MAETRPKLLSSSALSLVAGGHQRVATDCPTDSKLLTVSRIPSPCVRCFAHSVTSAHPVRARDSADPVDCTLLIVLLDVPID